MDELEPQDRHAARAQTLARSLPTRRLAKSPFGSARIAQSSTGSYSLRVKCAQTSAWPPLCSERAVVSPEKEQLKQSPA